MRNGNMMRLNRVVVLLELLLLAFVMLGCGPTQQEKIQRTAQHIRQVVIAMDAYSVENSSRLPESFDQLTQQNYLDPQTLMNPRTGDNPGFIMIRPGERRARMQGNEFVVFELLDGQPNPEGLGARVDGSVAMDASVGTAVKEYLEAKKTESDQSKDASKKQAK